jgi:hypothetical protein
MKSFLTAVLTMSTTILLATPSWAQGRYLSFGRASEGQNTWKIRTVEVVQKKENPVPETDPAALYKVELSLKDETTTVLVLYYDLRPVLRYFHFSSPSDLEGNRFESDKNDSDEAFEIFSLTARNNGVYVRPTFDNFITEAAESLAKLECPLFDNVDSQTTRFHASSLYQDYGIQRLNEEIQKRNPSVRLVQALDQKGFYLVRGPSVRLYLMKGDEIAARLTFVADTQPVIFGDDPYGDKQRRKEWDLSEQTGH